MLIVVESVWSFNRTVLTASEMSLKNWGTGVTHLKTRGRVCTSCGSDETSGIFMVTRAPQVLIQLNAMHKKHIKLVFFKTGQSKIFRFKQ